MQFAGRANERSLVIVRRSAAATMTTKAMAELPVEQLIGLPYQREVVQTSAEQQLSRSLFNDIKAGKMFVAEC
ncbi:MAG: hypothetical protein A3H44_04445 [Gammaproteobacteria bacterium RIFCSPLOWO2_02_FULL_57_10]|nr:MAG: hypothetical protein A3H44_04445 [Gammaproteobacteria bacterium RIFCSPLOWO2_02_FULL_57_10]